MNTKDFFGILLMAMFAVVGLTACSNDDEPKDSVKEIRMQISAETGVMYAWGDDKKENPIECNTPHITEFVTIPKSLPRSMRNTHK